MAVVGLDGTVIRGSGGVESITLAPNADGTRRTVSFAELYRSQPFVFALVNKLSHHVATLPLKVYERQADGQRKRVTDPEDSLVRLLYRPAARYGPVHLKQWLVQPLLVHGNAVVAKYREKQGEPPVELLPMDWRYLSAYAQQGGPIQKWVTNETGKWYEIDAGETVHAAWMSPTCRDLGVSPLEALGVTLRLDDAARRYQTSNFENTARPSGIISLPPDVKVTDEQKASLRQSIDAMHRGVDNAFRVALMGGGAKWEPISFSAQEAELIATRQISREEACIAYDVAPTVIGDLTHGTYSNVSELRMDFYRSTLRPICTLLEETIQAHLIDPEPEWADRFVEFDMSEQLKGDPLAQAQALETQVGSGVLTLNEARRILNLAPSKDPHANELLVQVNNLAPVSHLGDPPSAMPDKPVGQ